MIPDSSNARTTFGIAARIAFVLLLGSSASLVIILTATWIAAWRTGVLPDTEAWSHYAKTGNGPWDHNGTMLAYIDYVFFAAEMTFVSGVAAIFLIPNVPRKWFGVLMTAVAVATMWYHFCLID